MFFYHLFDMKLCDLHEENFETASTEMWILGDHEYEEYILIYIIQFIRYSVVLQKICNSVVCSVAVDQCANTK